MALNDQELWQKFVTQLTDLATAGQFDKKKQVICFYGTTRMIDLADADPAISNYNIYDVGNCIPKWSTAYAPNSDLIGSYATFLNYIDLGGDPNPNLDSQINIAAGNLTQAQVNFLTQSTTAITNWQDMQKTMPDLTFPQYLRNYGDDYKKAKKAQDSAQKEYWKLLRQKSGVDYQSLLNAQMRVSFDGGARNTIQKNEYNMKAKVGAEAPSGSKKTLPGQTPPAPSSSLSELLLPAYNLDAAFTKAYQEWQKKSANNQVDVGPIEVTGTTKASQSSEFGGSDAMMAKGFGIFFYVHKEKSVPRSSIATSWQSTNFDFKVYFTGLQTFKIGPVPWFQPSFIQNYKDKLYPNAPKFFGEGGSLSLLPYELILGFEPKLELTLDNADYQEVKTSFQAQASASIGIGPFRIGSASFSTYGSKDDMSYNDESHTISIGPIKSTQPILLGVICSKL